MDGKTGAGTIRRLPDGDADGRKSMGVSIALLSSTMTFGGLLLLYALLRAGAPTWTSPGSSGLPLLLAFCATAVITVSSFTLHRGVREVMQARPRRLLPWLVPTIALGLAFLLLELVLWVALWGGGFVPGQGQTGAFYVITGFHFAHVLVAVGLLLWLVPGAARARYHGRNQIRVRLVARFWHFLGLNWALLFAAFFLW